MITIKEERKRLAGYINHSATVFGPDKKDHGTISVTEDKIVYSDGYAIYFDFPLEKAAAVVNFFKSAGSTIGPFGPTVTE
tara:strand:- start:192 stop:431 length:240 start_codon:yes stop_codon:yes gene_type:complete